MDKLKIKLAVIITIFLIGNFNFVASAAVTDDDTDKNENILDSLLPRPGENYQYGDARPELEAIGNLPEITPEAAFTTVIKTILGASMALTIIAICVVGYYYLVNQGDEEETGKAKKIIIYLVVGMAIMAGAYGIISGIAQFNFFRPID